MLIINVGGAFTNDRKINGRWNESEKIYTYMELFAIRQAVFRFLPLIPVTKHLRIMTDNSTSVSCINEQGVTHLPMCNNLTIKIWEICIKHFSYLSAGKPDIDFLATRLNKELERYESSLETGP